MQVLSIQSAVSYGYVGNSAAVFALQRLGHEVWPVPTVLLSNHTGYEGWRGPRLSAEDVGGLCAGLADRGVLGRVDAVLSGYLGSPEVADVVADVVTRLKEQSSASYCCDPVIGDVGGVYVDDGVDAVIRDRLLPVADVATPNQFELDHLTGRTTRSLDDVVDAADELRSRGPRHVLVTSVLPGSPDVRPSDVSMVAVADEGAWVVTTPRLPISVNGAGDVATALYLAHLHDSGSPALALSRTTATVYGLLEATRVAGTRELALVAAQDRIVEPGEEFEPKRLRRGRSPWQVDG